jgi:hypothetical protein
MLSDIRRNPNNNELRDFNTTLLAINIEMKTYQQIPDVAGFCLPDSGYRIKILGKWKDKRL